MSDCESDEDCPAFDRYAHRMDELCYVPHENSSSPSLTEMKLKLFGPKLRVYVGVNGHLPEKKGAGYFLLASRDHAGYQQSRPDCMDLHIHLRIPDGYCGLITTPTARNPRSGILVVNDVISSSHRESIIIFFRTTTDSEHISKGEPIAFLTIVPVMDNERIVQVKSINDL